MGYLVKEAFLTLQGEGAHAGRAAVFCRFSGCNLWTGREEHRSMAVCQFCDTDFVGTDGDGGGRFRSADELVAHLDALAGAVRFVVCTGGEPLLQLDAPLIDALHERDFEIAIETNGTLPIPDGIDWVCVSPKANADLVATSGDELKLVYRQDGGEPERYAGLDFRHFFLQPMDGPDRERFTAEAIAYCRTHPQWRLSIQTHKYVGIP